MPPTTTLLSYLNRPNFELNRTNLKTGPNTLAVGSHDIEGVRPWTDFTLGKILDCFGDVLQVATSPDRLYQPSPIPEHFRNLTDESCVDAILLKHNHVKVDCALQVAAARLKDHGLQLPISWSWGSLSSVEEDRRLRPDWAGTVHSQGPPYVNRVPGDTKQSKKWTSTMKDSTVRGYQEEFRKPLRQALLCCTKVNSRYGYIITDAEAFFFRRTKSEEPARPLSINRPQRQYAQPSQPTHGRVTSITSVISGTSTMSIDSSGSPYTDAGNPDINEQPLDYAVVPWGSSGSDSLSINLGLFFIHLLAASDNSVQEWYPVLGTWQTVTDSKDRTRYRQVGSNRNEAKLPRGATLAGSPPAISANPSGSSVASSATATSVTEAKAGDDGDDDEDDEEGEWDSTTNDKGQTY